MMLSRSCFCSWTGGHLSPQGSSDFDLLSSAPCCPPGSFKQAPISTRIPVGLRTQPGLEERLRLQQHQVRVAQILQNDQKTRKTEAVFLQRGNNTNPSPCLSFSSSSPQLQQEGLSWLSSPCLFCVILPHSSGRKSRVYFQCQTNSSSPTTRRTILKGLYFTLPSPKGRGLIFTGSAEYFNSSPVVCA